MALVKLNNNGVKNATAFGSITGLGSMTFIKKLTASGSSTLSFVNGASGVVLNNTYKEYLFTFNNIHPGTNNKNFTFNLSIDTGSNYNVTKTTSAFATYHNEADSAATLEYRADLDLAQSTAFQNLGNGVGGEADECLSGELKLFNPSSTTFVKHFINVSQFYEQQSMSLNSYIAGYANTTSAVDAIQFKMNSGNIDAGDICLYGIA